MPSFKKTEINASLFPVAGGYGQARSGPLVDGSQTTTAVNSPMASTTVLKTEDVSDPREEATTANASAATSVNGDALEKHGKIILVKFAEDDEEDPMQWSNTRKWTLTILLNLLTLCIGLSTSAYSVGINRMSQELGFSTEVAQIGMFAFNFSCAITPLLAAPLCEIVGRRFVYTGAFAAFVAVTPMLAWGQNLATQLIGRFLQGAFGSIGTILVGGTFNDIWSTEEISVPMSIFTFMAIFSTVAAPAYCGYIDEKIGWRWVQIVHLILSGCVLVAEVLFLRESRGDAILLARAKKLRKETGDDRFRAQVELEGDSIAELFRASSLRALQMLIREPVVLLFGIWLALAWGTVFLFLTAIPLSFQTNRGWSEGNSGLPYLGLIIGCFIGFGVGFWQDSMYDRATKRNNGVPVPEARLYGAMVFSPCFPIGMFIYAFTQDVHWIASCIALVVIIVGIYAIFSAVYNYTAEAYPAYASSAIAAQGLLRNGFGAVTPLFANYMLRSQGLGIRYGGLLLACVASLCTILPFLFFKLGPQIRARSSYASNDGALEAKPKAAPRKGDVEKAGKTQDA